MRKAVIILSVLLLIAGSCRQATNEFNHKTGKYLEVDGASIYYEEIKNLGKPILLFLHGGFGNIEGFWTTIYRHFRMRRILRTQWKCRGIETIY